MDAKTTPPQNPIRTTKRELEFHMPETNTEEFKKAVATRLEELRIADEKHLGYMDESGQDIIDFAKNRSNHIIEAEIPKEWPKSMSTLESLKFDVIHCSKRFINFAENCFKKIHV